MWLRRNVTDPHTFMSSIKILMICLTGFGHSWPFAYSSGIWTLAIHGSYFWNCSNIHISRLLLLLRIKVNMTSFPKKIYCLHIIRNFSSTKCVFFNRAAFLGDNLCCAFHLEWSNEGCDLSESQLTMVVYSLWAIFIF